MRIDNLTNYETINYNVPTCFQLDKIQIHGGKTVAMETRKPEFAYDKKNLLINTSTRHRRSVIIWDTEVQGKL